MFKSCITDNCYTQPVRPFPKLMKAKISGNIYFVRSATRGICIHKNPNHIGACQDVGAEMMNIDGLSDFTGSMILTQD